MKRLDLETLAERTGIRLDRLQHCLDARLVPERTWLLQADDERQLDGIDELTGTFLVCATLLMDAGYAERGIAPLLNMSCLVAKPGRKPLRVPVAADIVGGADSVVVQVSDGDHVRWKVDGRDTGSIRVRAGKQQPVPDHTPRIVAAIGKRESKVCKELAYVRSRIRVVESSKHVATRVVFAYLDLAGLVFVRNGVATIPNVHPEHVSHITLAFTHLNVAGFAPDQGAGDCEADFVDVTGVVIGPFHHTHDVLLQNVDVSDCSTRHLILRSVWLVGITSFTPSVSIRTPYGKIAPTCLKQPSPVSFQLQALQTD